MMYNDMWFTIINTHQSMMKITSNEGFSVLLMVGGAFSSLN